MKRLATMIAAAFVLSMVLSSPVALAAPGDSEAPPSTGSGGAPPPDTSKPPPDTSAPADATKPPPDANAAPAPADPDVSKSKEWPEKMYGLGVSFMFNIVPHFMLAAFTEAAVNKHYNVYPMAGAIHFIRRKKLLDMKVRLAFGYYGIKDGNWLGKGHDFSEVDYTEFHNVNFLWADVTWTWHTKLAKQFYLGYGTGIGIGWVMGKVYTTPSNNCTKSNYSDTNICNPGPPAVCDGTSCSRESLASHPLREQEKSVPPVLPAINFHIGLRWDIFRHLSMTFDTGIFLPGFFHFQLALTAFF